MQEEVIKHQRVTAMASQFETAMREIDQAKELLTAAENRLKLEFGQYCTFDYRVMSELENQPVKMKKCAWRYILRQSQVTAFLSLKRNEQLDKQIEEDQLPDLTEDNILSTLQSFIGDSGSLLDETVKEVFEWLKPWRQEGYKTNKKYSIGRKVIKDWIVTAWGHGFHIRYEIEKELTALDNAFNLLDGKGVRRNPDNLVTCINAAMKEKQQTYEDDFFKCKWYLKGTMHIEFKRLDLLEKLNKIGGNERQVGDREYSRKQEGLVPCS